MTTRCDRLQSLSLAVVLAAGAGVIWAIASVFLCSVVNGVFLSPNVSPNVSTARITGDEPKSIVSPNVSTARITGDEPKSINEQVFVLIDGTPCIASTESNDGYETTSYRSLDGKSMQQAGNTPTLGAYSLHGPRDAKKRFTGLPWRARIQTITSRTVDNTVWYFVHDGKLRGRGYIVGYDAKNVF